MAEKYWLGQNPLGKTVRIESGNRLVTIVGVAADGKYVDIDEAPRPFMYFDLNQHYQPTAGLIVRTASNPQQWLKPLVDVLGNETYRDARHLAARQQTGRVEQPSVAGSARLVYRADPGEDRIRPRCFHSRCRHQCHAARC